MLTGIAKACEQNLRKTFQYGGRSEFPNSMELKAMMVSAIWDSLISWSCTVWCTVAKQQCGPVSLRLAGAPSGSCFFSREELSVTLKSKHAQWVHWALHSTCSAWFCMRYDNVKSWLNIHVVWASDICVQIALDVIEELCYEMALQRLDAMDEYAVFVVIYSGKWHWDFRSIMD